MPTLIIFPELNAISLAALRRHPLGQYATMLQRLGVQSWGVRAFLEHDADHTGPATVGPHDDETDIKSAPAVSAGDVNVASD